MRSIPARQPLNVALHRTLSTADDLDVKPRVAVDCRVFTALSSESAPDVDEPQPLIPLLTKSEKTTGR
jgi:hypothetical protein